MDKQRHLPFPFKDKCYITIDNSKSSYIECELAESVIEVFQSLNFRKEQEFTVPLFIIFENPNVQSYVLCNYDFAVEHICVNIEGNVAKSYLQPASTSKASFIHAYSSYRFIILAPVGFIKKYNIKNQTSIKFNLSFGECGNSFRIIPMKCPFTGQTIYDDDGYNEPFPETLICTDFRRDIVYYSNGYEVVDEVLDSFNALMCEAGSKQLAKELLRKLNSTFSWLELEENIYAGHLFEHPLIKKEYNENEYDNPGASGFSAVFALAENHELIINDFKLLLAEISLLRAYLVTEFIVFEEDLIIQIGQKNLPLNKFLKKHGVKTWSFITAWNPFSKVLTDEENTIRHQELIALTNRYKTFEGEGRGTDPQWKPERSLLILGISREEAIRIGKHFEQNAIVVVGEDAIPKLVLLR